MAIAEHELSTLLPHAEEQSLRSVAFIHHEFGAKLRRFFLRSLACEADAEDYTQEVYFRMVRQGRLDRIDSLGSFVFTTAANLLRDRSRRLTTRMDESSISCEHMDLVDCCEDPAQRTEHFQALERTFQALEDLNVKSRQAFLLSRLEGLTYGNIAEEMDISISMVEKHISAALHALRSRPQ